MTPEDIIRLAREAGFTGFDSQSERLHDFARLVAAAERNACLAEFMFGRNTAEIKSAIRARSKE